jgi:putative transposase
MLERVEDWRDYLSAYRADDEDLVRRHTRTGRPLGCDQFIAGLEKMLQRKLTPSKKGRKRKT